MDQIELLDRTQQAVGRLVAGVRPDQMGAATPCADYDVRALLNHVVGGAAMFAECARGQTPELHEDPAEDLLGDDPAAAFAAAAGDNLAAWRRPGVLDGEVSLPFATLPAPAALGVVQAELSIHAWDLARATGQAYDLPDDVVQAAWATAQLVVTDEFRGPDTFDSAQTVAEDASLGDRLAAHCGRTP